MRNSFLVTTLTLGALMGCGIVSPGPSTKDDSRTAGSSTDTSSNTGPSTSPGTTPTSTDTGSSTDVGTGTGTGTVVTTAPTIFGSWAQIPLTDAPTISESIGVFWTGTKLLVIGHEEYEIDGGLFDAKANTWSSLEESGKPSDRGQFTAAFGSGNLFIWGGLDKAVNFLKSGSLLNLTTNTWKSISLTGAPNARIDAQSIAVGSKFFVFGGSSLQVGWHDDGGIYDPATDSWTKVPAAPRSFDPRSFTLVFDGKQVLLWGGRDGDIKTDDSGTLLNEGYAFDLGTNLWKSLPTSGAPSPRFDHAAVWTGTEMIVWGGYGKSGANTNGLLQDGGRYNPTIGKWLAIPAAGAPPSARRHSAVWTGKEMLVFGGKSSAPTAAGQVPGGAFDPATGTWRHTTATNAPVSIVAERGGRTAYGEGKMFVFGGSIDAPVPSSTTVAAVLTP